MLRPRKLIAAAVLAAAATAIAAVPAVADPINGDGKPVTPRASDLVGFGTDTTAGVFNQLSLDYNKTIRASAPHLYSWNAANPKTGDVHDLVRPKTGCSEAPRPYDSSQAILGSGRDPLGLTANTRSQSDTFCSDFARSSLGREGPDEQGGPGGVQFLPFALDAVTYATNAKTNAPAELSTTQLAEIYTCAVRNWRRVGGSNAPIDAQLPQVNSGTREQFLTVLGAGKPITPGPCVDNAGQESPGNLPEQNEGVNKYLQGPNVIYPYSVSAYIAEAYHSAKCLVTSCAPVKGVICRPRRGQNRFGCDTRGNMVLHMINKTAPTVPFPLPKTCGKAGCPTLNRRFTPAFVRKLFIVVRWTAGTPGDIPGYLERLFGPQGYVCSTLTAHTDLRHYGFMPLAPAFTADGPSILKMTC